MGGEGGGLLDGGDLDLGGLDGGDGGIFDEPAMDPFDLGGDGSDMPGDFDPGMSDASGPAAGMDDGGYGGGYGGGDDGSSYDPLPDPSGMDGMDA